MNQSAQPFPLSLFAAIMRGAPFQPATNLWRAVELTALIEKALPSLADAQAILDLGCGDGEIMRLLRPYLPHGAAITGIDLDPAEVVAAQSSGLYAQVVCTGAQEMPLPDAFFDAIISNSVLEHIPPIESVLAESARVLKRGGWFIATVPSDTFHTCLKGSWQRGVSREAYNNEMDARLAHCRYWGAEEWAVQLSRIGLRMMAATPYLDRAQTQRWELLSRLTGGLLYYLTGKNQRPIFVQRRLGMRGGARVPLVIAKVLAWVFAFGLKRDDAMHSCLLVIGRKEA